MPAPGPMAVLALHVLEIGRKTEVKPGQCRSVPISGFEAMMKDYRTDRVFREKMQGYTELWITGKREILQVA